MTSDGIIPLSPNWAKVMGCSVQEHWALSILKNLCYHCPALSEVDQWEGREKWSLWAVKYTEKYRAPKQLLFMFYIFYTYFGALIFEEVYRQETWAIFTLLNCRLPHSYLLDLNVWTQSAPNFSDLRPRWQAATGVCWIMWNISGLHLLTGLLNICWINQTWTNTLKQVNKK